jgi:hypothetical protein
MAEEVELTLLDRLLDSENSSNIELFAEDGTKVEFEQVAVLLCDEKPFAILHPITAVDNEVAVFELFDDDEEVVEFVEDKTLAQKVINKYIEFLSNANKTPEEKLAEIPMETQTEIPTETPKAEKPATSDKK